MPLEYIGRIQNELRRFGVKHAVLLPHDVESTERYRRLADPSFYTVSNTSAAETLRDATLVIGPLSARLFDAANAGATYYAFEPALEITQSSYRGAQIPCATDNETLFGLLSALPTYSQHALGQLTARLQETAPQTTLDKATTAPVNGTRIDFGERCPVTGGRGTMLWERSPEELAESYANYLGAPLPPQIVKKYFREPCREYECAASGLRWYTPGVTGEEDFYSTLGAIYPWYYRDESWDKDLICDILQRRRAKLFVEFGCGNGAFLRQAQRAGIHGIGIEIDSRAVEHCRRDGLAVYHQSEVPVNLPVPDALCMLQTLEHVPNPVEFVRSALALVPAKVLIFSTPCFQALLGHTRDPLSWPPHHFTSWSDPGFRALGERMGYRVLASLSEPLKYERLEGMLEMERSRKLRGLPEFPVDRHAAEQLLQEHQRQGAKWALYSHSIVAVLGRIQ